MNKDRLTAFTDGVVAFIITIMVLDLTVPHGAARADRLSLVPFTTAWLGENQFARVPTSVYGVSLLMPAIAYYVLQIAILRQQGPDGPLAKALGRDFKGKVSVVLYLVAIAASFVAAWVSHAIYIGVALMWLLPDR